jgi:phosphoribosylamine--glycine ligase
VKVLVVGGGGREHALCWKIGQSPLVAKVYCAPGNAGTALVAENVDIAAEDIKGLVAFAKGNSIGLVVVGPEAPLCMGIVDEMKKVGIRCFGPNKAAAEIEGSKLYARELCRRHRIPSPQFWSFEDAHGARAFLDMREDGPIVVKASGLAAGKGVTVCKKNEEALAAVAECLERRRFGDAGSTVVLEEFLEGQELSVMTLTDGKTIVPFEPARDHKAVFDGDKGPNTGGMGAVTPVHVQGRAMTQIENQVVFPTVHAMNRENRPYQGFLYSGLMLTPQGPRVLEYNCRLGDPETEPLLMRLSSDLVPLLIATCDEKLEEQQAPNGLRAKAPKVRVAVRSRFFPMERRSRRMLVEPRQLPPFFRLQRRQLPGRETAAMARVRMPAVAKAVKRARARTQDSRARQARRFHRVLQASANIAAQAPALRRQISAWAWGWAAALPCAAACHVKHARWVRRE